MALRRATGSATRRLRRLSTPKQLQVRTDAAGRPRLLFRSRGPVRVEQIQESWRIDDEWWREPISRRYHRVVLADGGQLTLYRDRITGGWFLHE